MTENSSLHLAIIPDGNRRWAKEHSLLPWKGHEKAQNTMKAIADWSLNKQEIGTLTLWVFSTENWSRNAKEVEMIMKMLVKALTKQRKIFQENQTRFVHSGRKDRLNDKLKKLLEDIEEETKHFDTFTVNLALDYGGKDEIIRAANKMGNNITEESLCKHLDHPELPDIDLIIRTSGEKRTSNFFLWQSVYAEWFFVDKYFPDITTDDLEAILGEYHSRQRRYGK